MGTSPTPACFPWLAQEAAADAYGILSVERKLGDKAPVRQAGDHRPDAEFLDVIATTRMRPATTFRKRLRFCPRNRSDEDAVQCAISTAYYTVGSIANDEQGSPYPVDSPPQLIYELGLQKIAAVLKIYDVHRPVQGRVQRGAT